MSRAAIVTALEALEDGDQALAVAILLGALEDGPTERSHRCECGAAFEWPGLLDAHRHRSGHTGRRLGHSIRALPPHRNVQARRSS